MGDPAPARCRRPFRARWTRSGGRAPAGVRWRSAGRRPADLYRLVGRLPLWPGGPPRVDRDHVHDGHDLAVGPSGTAPTAGPGPAAGTQLGGGLSLIHISEPTRP